MALVDIPLTISEQIANLKSKNLIIENENEAITFLNDVDYFRFAKAFSKDLKELNGNYKNGVSFNQLKDLYLFDANLRQLLFSEIEYVEINLRCRIANYFALKYGPFGYSDKNNFINISGQSNELNKKKVFLDKIEKDYNELQLPIYEYFENVSFGLLYKFFKNMKNVDKKALSTIYKHSYRYLESWFEHIAYVRNICAHYGKLYGEEMNKKPLLDNKYQKFGIDNKKIYATLICLSQLIPNNIHWQDFIDNIDYIIKKHKYVDTKNIGFPIDWKKYLV